MKFVNLTNYDIVFPDGSKPEKGEPISYRLKGHSACEMINDIPIIDITVLLNVPKPENDTIYIVPFEFAALCRDRKDIVFVTSLTCKRKNEKNKKELTCETLCRLYAIGGDNGD